MDSFMKGSMGLHDARINVPFYSEAEDEEVVISGIKLRLDYTEWASSADTDATSVITPVMTPALSDAEGEDGSQRSGTFVEKLMPRVDFATIDLRPEGAAVYLTESFDVDLTERSFTERSFTERSFTERSFKERSFTERSFTERSLGAPSGGRFAEEWMPCRSSFEHLMDPATVDPAGDSDIPVYLSGESADFFVEPRMPRVFFSLRDLSPN